MPIPTSFHEMKIRADHIGGEIKQADADIQEARLLRERAERALATAAETERRCVERAAEKRAERTELAAALAAYVHKLGDAEDTESPPPRVADIPVEEPATQQVQF
jgi:hypothetical protein